MAETDKEDLMIRRVLIASGLSLVVGFLFTVVVIAVMISSNFNIMRWLE